MAIESTSDRSAYMSAFGTTCVVGASTITAIFDDPHLEALESTTSTPMLTAITTDVSGATFGTAVTVAEVSFAGSVIDIQDDGTGITVLMLRSN